MRKFENANICLQHRAVSDASDIGVQLFKINPFFMPSCTQPPVINLTCLLEDQAYLLEDQTYLVSGNADLLDLDSTRGPRCAAPVPVNASNLIQMSKAAQVAPDGMLGITTCKFRGHTAPSILWVFVDLLHFFWKDQLALASRFSLNV